MNYEEKYKNALERANIIYTGKYKPEIAEWTKKTLEAIFPELKESKNEKIRKELKRAIAIALDYSYFDKETADNCIAWLEKQGKKGGEE